MNDGKFDVYKKLVGKMLKVFDVMIDDFVNLNGEIDDIYVFIIYLFVLDLFEYIKNRVEKEVKVKYILEGYVGCVIFSYCGEGIIGILYIKR